MLRFLAGIACVLLGLVIISQAMLATDLNIPVAIKTPSATRGSHRGARLRQGYRQVTETRTVYSQRDLVLYGLPFLLAGGWLLLTSIDRKPDTS